MPKEAHHLPLQPLLVLLRLLLQCLDLVGELLHQLRFLLEVALLLLLEPLSLCLKFRIELEKCFADLIISSKPPNQGSTHRVRGHTICVVGPYAIDAILRRTTDCIHLYHILVNRWVVLSAIHDLLGLLRPNLLQSLCELSLQLQLRKTN